MAAQAGKIALGPVKIRPTGQQNLTKNFQKLSCGPVDLAVQRGDCIDALVNTLFNIIFIFRNGENLLSIILFYYKYMCIFIDDFIIQEHIHDVNAFVRSKLLQIWWNIVNEKVNI